MVPMAPMIHRLKIIGTGVGVVSSRMGGFRFGFRKESTRHVKRQGI